MKRLYKVITEDEYEDHLKFGETSLPREYSLLNVIFHPNHYKRFIELSTEKLNEQMIPFHIVETRFWENNSLDFVTPRGMSDDMKLVFEETEKLLVGEITEKKQVERFGSTSLIKTDTEYIFPTTGVTLPGDYESEDDGGESDE